MNRRAFAFTAATVALAAALPAQAAKPPATWDGLARVKSKKLDSVYLLPGADFRAYTKVQLDPTEVAFQKNWQRTYNNEQLGLSGRISNEEAQQIAGQVRTGFEEIFAKAYRDAGYEVVTTAGPDVVRLRTAVADLTISSPDTNEIGRTRSYSVDAGEATLILEVRDSATGALLGRAVDRRAAGDNMSGLGAQRTSVSNRADFSSLFRSWAKASVNGLAVLKEASPVDTAGLAAKK